MVNLGRRRTVAGTVLYQLSHCGIHDKHHTITWFGSLSYNKLRVKMMDGPRKRCPVCGRALIRVGWFGQGPDPLDGQPEGEYRLDPDGWRYTARIR